MTSKSQCKGRIKTRYNKNQTLPLECSPAIPNQNYMEIVALCTYSILLRNYPAIPKYKNRTSQTMNKKKKIVGPLTYATRLKGNITG